jgi:hypothetical protein
VNYIGVTVGEALVGILVAIYVLLPWWRKSSPAAAAGPALKKGAPAAPARGGRNWRELRMFAFAFAVGVLAMTTAGGAIGYAAHWTGSASGTVGDWALKWLTGAQSQTIGRHGLGPLGPGGSVVLVALVFSLGLILRSTSNKKLKRDVVYGTLTGICLGPTAGILGIAGVVLVPAVNMLGDKLVGLL